MFIAGYFAFHYDSDPESCFAFEDESEHHEHAITKDMKRDGDYTNVGESFRGGFTTLFFSMFIIFLGNMAPYYVKDPF